MKEMTLREVCSTVGISRRAVQGYEQASLVSASIDHADTDAREKMKSLDNGELSTVEALYYAEVTSRISRKLLDAE